MLTVAPAQTSRFEKEQKKKKWKLLIVLGGASKSQPKAHAIKLRKKNQYCCVEVKNKLETCKSLE